MSPRWRGAPRVAARFDGRLVGCLGAGNDSTLVGLSWPRHWRLSAPMARLLVRITDRSAFLARAGAAAAMVRRTSFAACGALLQRVDAMTTSTAGPRASCRRDRLLPSPRPRA